MWCWGLREAIPGGKSLRYGRWRIDREGWGTLKPNHALQFAASLVGEVLRGHPADGLPTGGRCGVWNIDQATGAWSSTCRWGQQSPLVIFIQTSNFTTPKPTTGSVISGEALWPQKAGTGNPAARTFTADVLASLENQAEGDTEGFQQGKDVTQAGLSRYDLRSYRWVESYYRDPGKCDWRLQLGFCDFLIESVVNKCNFILDTYGDTVDIQHYQVEWMNIWVTQRHRYVDQSTP